MSRRQPDFQLIRGCASRLAAGRPPANPVRHQLPPAPPDAEHVFGDPMGAMLAANTTNLHTHGLIVEPRRATADDPTYGDFVYVLGYPKGKLPSMQDPGLDYTDQPINYDIYIPKNHPSGLFWFHPHAHGLALNQVSEGLAGIITVGSPDDYLSLNGRRGLPQVRRSAASF
jgi:L-ascorbate oxidase